MHEGRDGSEVLRSGMGVGRRDLGPELVAGQEPGCAFPLEPGGRRDIGQHAVIADIEAVAEIGFEQPA